MATGVLAAALCAAALVPDGRHAGGRAAATGDVDATIADDDCGSDGSCGTGGAAQVAPPAVTWPSGTIVQSAPMQWTTTSGASTRWTTGAVGATWSGTLTSFPTGATGDRAACTATPPAVMATGTSGSSTGLVMVGATSCVLLMPTTPGGTTWSVVPTRR